MKKHLPVILGAVLAAAHTTAYALNANDRALNAIKTGLHKTKFKRKRSKREVRGW